MSSHSLSGLAVPSMYRVNYHLPSCICPLHVDSASIRGTFLGVFSFLVLDLDLVSSRRFAKRDREISISKKDPDLASSTNEGREEKFCKSRRGEVMKTSRGGIGLRMSSSPQASFFSLLLLRGCFSFPEGGSHLRDETKADRIQFVKKQ